MSTRLSRRGEKGQALAEAAVISVVAILMIFGTFSMIAQHRARTAAIAASYACAQFLSQAPNPGQAAAQARAIAQRTLDADWSGLIKTSYRVSVSPPSGPGMIGSCTVAYNSPFLFNGLFGIPDEWVEETFSSRSESWKADW